MIAHTGWYDFARFRRKSFGRCAELHFKCSARRGSCQAKPQRGRAPLAPAPEHLGNWQASAFRNAEDVNILSACFDDSRVLVTYEQRTIPSLLRRWAEEERSHAGVIFGDGDSVPPNDPGAVAASLVVLIEEMSGMEMTNVVRYLRRV